jgi:hypothetical protein
VGDHSDREEWHCESEGAAERYPTGWEAIRADQAVLAKEEGPWQGWWEAVVSEVSGDVVTMRSRNHSHLPPIVRHRCHLGLMRPNGD